MVSKLIDTVFPDIIDHTFICTYTYLCRTNVSYVKIYKPDSVRRLLVRLNLFKKLVVEAEAVILSYSLNGVL